MRRVLAHAKAAYVIPEGDARRLMDEGYAPEPCGAEVAPEKTILFVHEARLAAIEARRPIRVGLGPEFLAARAIALVPFEDTGR